MYRTSARLKGLRKLPNGRIAFNNQSCMCNHEVTSGPRLPYGSRTLSTVGSQARGGTGTGKVVVGMTVAVTGVLAGGIYYANIDPTFRQSVEDSVPYASSLLNVILGENDLKKSPAKPPANTATHHISKKSFENNFPLAKETLSVIAGEDKPSSLSEKPGVPAEEIFLQTETDHTPPASVSSVDQIGVSSVDLDISKTVEKGMSGAKKGSSEPMKEEIKLTKDNGRKSVEEACECSSENESLADAAKEKQSETALEETTSDAITGSIIQETERTDEMIALDVALNAGMATVSDLGQKTIELYERAVGALQHHKNSVKEALERFEKDGVSKEDWEVLEKLSKAKSQVLDEAEKVGGKLSDMVEQVQSTISEARDKGLDSSAEVASETLAKLTYALQQVKNRLSKTQEESSLRKQFQDLVKEGRENLARELAAIKPGFDINVSQSKEVEASLEYARKRISILEEALRKRDEEEGKFVEEALRKQEEDLKKLSAMKLNHEVHKLKTEFNDTLMKKDIEDAERHENDLRTQLRRQAAAFSDHLNEVLKVQEAELKSRHDVEVREKLLLAKQELELKLRGALARLNGIITAISDQANVEKRNVEAQELWLACHSLRTVISGVGEERLRPYPIHAEVDTIRRVNEDDEVVGAVLDSLSDNVQRRGVFTEESLRRRFPIVKRVCKQVAMVGEDGGGIWSHLLSYLQSLFIFESRAVKPPSAIDLEAVDTFQLLKWATYALENGDTEQAVRYMNQLGGEPRRIARDWIREARLLLEAKQAARFLTSFASAYNISVEQEK